MPLSPCFFQSDPYHHVTIMNLFPLILIVQLTFQRLSLIDKRKIYFEWQQNKMFALE